MIRAASTNLSFANYDVDYYFTVLAWKIAVVVDSELPSEWGDVCSSLNSAWWLWLIKELCKLVFLLPDDDEHLRPSSLGLSFLRAVDTQTLANFVGDKIRPRCRFHEFFASATYQPTQKRQQTM